jgi:hypothetical protein
MCPSSCITTISKSNRPEPIAAGSAPTSQFQQAGRVGQPPKAARPTGYMVGRASHATLTQPTELSKSFGSLTLVASRHDDFQWSVPMKQEPIAILLEGLLAEPS